MAAGESVATSSASRSIVQRASDPRLERDLIPLARETARYQSHLIKPRFAELGESYDDETVIEVVGLCAMGNFLCRMEALSRAG